MFDIIINLILSRTRWLHRYIGRRFDSIEAQLAELRADVADPGRHDQARIDAMVAGLTTQADALDSLQEK
jgi:hypothetical protein